MTQTYSTNKEAERKRLYRLNNPDKAMKARKVHRDRYPTERWLWRRAKYRSTKFGILFSIVPTDVRVPILCPVLGIKLEIGSNRNSTPTIDRIIPSLGYVKGNIRVISHRANRLKSDATLEELRFLVAYLENAA